MAGGDWPTYGHDLANTRTQDQEHLIGPSAAATLVPTWTFSSATAGGSGSFSGTPVVADGCVFAASDGGSVFALNADTGALVWSTALPTSHASVNSTLAVDRGMVFASVANVPDPPYTVALSEVTGKLVWRTTVDRQPGADLYSSPVAYKGVIFVGVSGGAAEVGDTSGTRDRYAFQGSYVLLDETSGALLKKVWTIHPPPNAPRDYYAGASVWSSPAVDTSTGYAYVGTGNPFQPYAQAEHADAILKIDLTARTSPTFGQILAFYQGNPDTFVPTKKLPCLVLLIAGRYPQGAGSCGQLDLDFGAAPNLFTDSQGRRLVGDGQKSGVYHAVDRATMRVAWQSTVGAPTSLGGIVGSTASSGRSIYGPLTVPGYLWSVGADRGSTRWITPTADAVHWGEAVSSANGVVYTVDTKGFLDAYAAESGAPLLHRPLLLGSGTTAVVANLGGGVAIARHTVYAVGGGYLVALRPGSPLGSSPGPSGPPAPGPPPGSAARVAVVAVPGSFAATYATPFTVIPKGGHLTFVNGDIANHNVVDSISQQGRTPRFSSGALIGLGGTADVAGVDRLSPGTYHYFCALHANMTGTLVVLP